MQSASLEAGGLPIPMRSSTGRTKRQFSPSGARNGSNGDGSAFKIIVAARVRPFNKRELKRWQKERQKQLGAMPPQLTATVAATATAATAVPASNCGNSNSNNNALSHAAASVNKRWHPHHHQRHPGGGGGDALSPNTANEALLSLLDSNGEVDPELLATLSETNPDMAEALRQAQRQLIHGEGASPHSVSMPDASPSPVVDVEPDQRTLTLLDPANASIARGAFTFDHIFSSFALTVELDLPGSERHHRQKSSSHKSVASPLALRSGAADDHSVNMSTAILSDDIVLSPQQEEQAELEQQRIFDLLGVPILESALQGFNACIFAYGQTSSGKTYTMLGTKRHWGITPRLLHSLFCRLSDGNSNNNSGGDVGVGVASAAGRPARRRGASAETMDTEAGSRGGSGAGQAHFSTGSPVSLPPVTSVARVGNRSGAPVGGDAFSPASQVLSSHRSTPSHRPLSQCPDPSSSASEAPPANGQPTVYVDVAYMEIYNEQVRDLLKQRPKNAILHYKSRFDVKDVNYDEYQTLKVRQHPEHGLFVEGLTSVRVNSWSACEKYLKEGSNLRTQAATSMNEASSRSHAIFQVTITQVEHLGGRVRGKELTSQRVSKINLVDLAGSERNSTGAVSSKGKKSHVQEANSINVSLSTLRRVMDALVTNSNIANNPASTKAPVVVPYRESLLTYVLSDNFGGNSKTVMCANISPCADNLNETESTLRYATLARGVRNRVKINDDPSARVIHELQNRILTLQDELAMAPSPRHVAELELDLEENAAALSELQEKHESAAQALIVKKERELELLSQLKQQQEQEAKWRREVQREREEKVCLQDVIRRLQEENKALVKTAADCKKQRERQTLDNVDGEATGNASGSALVMPRALPFGTASQVPLPPRDITHDEEEESSQNRNDDGDVRLIEAEEDVSAAVSPRQAVAPETAAVISKRKKRPPLAAESPSRAVKARRTRNSQSSTRNGGDNNTFKNKNSNSNNEKEHNGGDAAGGGHPSHRRSPSLAARRASPGLTPVIPQARKHRPSIGLTPRGNNNNQRRRSSGVPFHGLSPRTRAGDGIGPGLSVSPRRQHHQQQQQQQQQQKRKMAEDVDVTESKRSPFSAPAAGSGKYDMHAAGDQLSRVSSSALIFDVNGDGNRSNNPTPTAQGKKKRKVHKTRPAPPSDDIPPAMDSEVALRPSPPPAAAAATAAGTSPLALMRSRKQQQKSPPAVSTVLLDDGTALAGLVLFASPKAVVAASGALQPINELNLHHSGKTHRQPHRADSLGDQELIHHTSAWLADEGSLDVESESSLASDFRSHSRKEHYPLA